VRKRVILLRLINVLSGEQTQTVPPKKFVDGRHCCEPSTNRAQVALSLQPRPIAD